MKKTFTPLLVLAAILSVAQTNTSTSPEKPLTFKGCAVGIPDPTRSLTGSYVSFDPSMGGNSCFSPGQTVNLVFKAESYSPDWEYVYTLWLDFPSDWVVNSASLVGTPACDNGSWGTFSFTISPAHTVRIDHARYHGNGGSTCTAYYMVNVTAGANANIALVSWYWDGDGYGGTPHWPCSNNGYTPSGQSACDEMIYPPAYVPCCTGIWEDIATEPSGGRMDNVTVVYNNLIWSIAGGGTDQKVRSYNPATNTWSVITGSEFPEGTNYARSGAVYGSKVYFYGDAAISGFTGLWSYDLDNNIWLNESPGGTPPPHAGIWAPAWVADPETGLLYLTGGATMPGGGNLTSVYVYNAVTNTWLAPLPNFSSARDFHAAYIFRHPVTNHKMLIVVGGVNASSIVLSSTQCYNLETGTWNPENSDIPALPHGWWGMGYTQNNVGHLWLVGGADQDFLIIPNSIYYDIATGAWNDGGVYSATPVYRTSAAAYNGKVYKIGGSVIGFTPTGLASRSNLYPYSMPYKENFTGVPSSAIPLNWTRTHNQWAVNNSNLAGGSTPELRFFYYPVSTGVFRAATPLIDGSNQGLGRLRMSFKHMIHDYSGDYYLKVQASTNGTTWTDLWTHYQPPTASRDEKLPQKENGSKPYASVTGTDMFTGVLTEKSREENRSLVEFEFNNTINQWFYLAFVFEGNSNNINNWYVDDIKVEQVLQFDLTPQHQEKFGCPGEPKQFNLVAKNNSGSPITINLTYNITEGAGSISGGPPSLSLNAGQETSFPVMLEPHPFTPYGDQFVAEVTGSTPSLTRKATIALNVTGGEWQNIATEPDNGRMDNVLVTYNNLIWSIAGYGSNNDVRYYNPVSDTWTSVPGSAFITTNYSRSGAAHGSKAYFYADPSTSNTGLISYNMATNLWTFETPAGIPPAQTKIWAPAWVKDPESGFMYITGGATVPGQGNMKTVYVYNPAANAWLTPLPNFTTERDFHAAFIFTNPANGHKMLAVVGGYSATGPLSSTQCYDFTTGVWNAENADIPSLPQPWWGMGYAHNTLGAKHHLWLVGGRQDESTTVPGSIYYDVATGIWKDGGIYHANPVFRTSAISYNGEVYKMGGSTGGFLYTGLASKLFKCAQTRYPLPFSENFTEVPDGNIPVDWTRTHTNWHATSSNFAGGTPPEMVFFWSPYSEDVFRLITPVLDGASTTNCKLSFRHFIDHWGGPYSLKVQSTTDGNNWNTEWSINNPTNNVGPEQVVVDLSHLSGHVFQLAWVFNGNSFNIDNWYVDDIQVGDFVPGVPWNLPLVNHTVGSDNCYNAQNIITVTNMVIPSGVNVEMIAGNNIIFYPNTTVQQGAYLWAHISNVYCYQSPPILAAEEEVIAELRPAEVIPEPGKELFVVYPNPTTGIFTLALSGDENTQAAEMEIYSMLGERLLQRRLEGQQQFLIDLSLSPRGIYLIRIMRSNQMKVERIIKQ